MYKRLNMFLLLLWTEYPKDSPILFYCLFCWRNIVHLIYTYTQNYISYLKESEMEKGEREP